MTKKDQLKREYQKQRRRIQGTISRYKKKGFKVDFELPKIPKNITQGSINRLKNITTKKIQEKTMFYDPITETEVSYFRGQKIQKQRKQEQENAYKKLEKYEYDIQDSRGNLTDEYKRAKKEEYYYSFDYSDHVIDAFLSMIMLYPTKAEPYLRSWLTTAINNFGKEIVADGLAKAMNAGNMLTYKIAYDEQELSAYTDRLFSFFNVGKFEREEFETAWEESTHFEVYD